MLRIMLVAIGTLCQSLNLKQKRPPMVNLGLDQNLDKTNNAIHATTLHVHMHDIRSRTVIILKPLCQIRSLSFRCFCQCLCIQIDLLIPKDSPSVNEERKDRPLCQGIQG